jgi:uncharacterized membrane protein YvlD (DUF360 family)
LISLLALLLVSGLVILMVGSLTSSLEVKDFGTAIAVALAMAAAGWLLSTPLAMAQEALVHAFTGSSASSGPNGPLAYAIYINAAFAFVVNLILFLVVASVMSGVTIRGVLGPFLVVVLITAAEVFLPRALFEAGISF